MSTAVRQRRARRSAVYTELRRLEKQRDLTTKRVVDEARNPKSPLHSMFEWDDTVAGGRYRLIQAAELIRSFKVTMEIVQQGGPVNYDVALFVHDPAHPATVSNFTMSQRLTKAQARKALVAELQQIRGDIERAFGLAQQWKLVEEFRKQLKRVVSI